MDAYNMLQLLRDQVAEASASHWTDINLIRRLNVAQRKVAVLVQNYPAAWLLKSANLTPVASVITLPEDCAKPVYLEETTSGNPLTWLGNVRTRRVSRLTADSLGWTGAPEVYPLRNTLVVNQDSYTTGVTLWYDGRVPDLMAGTASAGAATSLTFPANSNVKHVDDYYNGVGIEVDSGTGAGTVGDVITDYAGATGVCVVTGTYGATSVFGTISLLPEETHHLILLEATLLAIAKPSSNIDKEVFQYYTNERREAIKEIKDWLETRIKGYGRVEITEDFI
uniref:Putative tail protein n=1 Tax=viral metagenome TaxID=1070528 RepID=A0A6H1ZCK9_9ZZZZ